MRRLFVALALIGFASAAGAADYELSDPPILRGSNPVVQTPYVPAPPTFTRWSGFYAGGQAAIKNVVCGCHSGYLPTAALALCR